MAMCSYLPSLFAGPAGPFPSRILIESLALSNLKEQLQ